MQPRILAALATVALSCARHDERLLSPELLASTGGEPLTSASALARVDHHLLLTLRLDAGSLTALDVREVPAALPLDRGRRDDGWRVVIESAEGHLLHLARMRAPAGVRPEVVNPDGTIEPVSAMATARVFAVRTPVLLGAARVRVFQGGVERGAADLRLEEHP